MTTMALEIEKNELIRRILEVNDMEILEKIKRVLLQEEKKINDLADEKYHSRPKTEI